MSFEPGQGLAEAVSAPWGVASWSTAGLLASELC